MPDPGCIFVIDACINQIQRLSPRALGQCNCTQQVAGAVQAAQSLMGGGKREQFSSQDQDSNGRFVVVSSALCLGEDKVNYYGRSSATENFSCGAGLMAGLDDLTNLFQL